jgi:hypothetical protein
VPKIFKHALFSATAAHLFKQFDRNGFWEELPTGNKFTLVLMIVQKKKKKTKTKVQNFFVHAPPPQILSHTFKGTYTTS